ncbi:MAG: hypothetical protein PHY92_00730 [Alphaproteobacteria bacterium]|nr:hypothetical protein [Alphaproteobacteria bacterium]
MATVQSSLFDTYGATRLPRPANTDEPVPQLTSDQKIIAWLFRSTVKTHPTASLSGVLSYAEAWRGLTEPNGSQDDWQIVANLCGYQVDDFITASAGLPLTAAEIDHFRRNHRETDILVGRDFLAAKSDLPSPLAELYGLYLHRARQDTEAALFVTQATGSTRVARIMGDLLAIGGFANGHECISHLTMTYSVPAAFDTSDLIDHANHEAARRLALPIEHPAHFLKLSPDEIGILAADIAERNVLSGPDFLEKANLLAEARQDVTRLPASQQFVTAVTERDLPVHQIWVSRICAAYARLFENWVMGVPEIDAVVNRHAGFRPQ